MGMIKHFLMSIEDLITSGVPAKDAVAELVAEYQLDTESEFVQELYRIYVTSPSSVPPDVGSPNNLH